MGEMDGAGNSGKTRNEAGPRCQPTGSGHTCQREGVWRALAMRQAVAVLPYLTCLAGTCPAASPYLGSKVRKEAAAALLPSD